MIDIAYDITIPANTSYLSPYALDVSLTEGVIKRVLINFHRGCRTMVYTALYYGGEHKLPHVDGQGYHFDNYILTLYPDWNLADKHHLITIKGWSPDTLYPHTLNFLFTIDDSGKSGDSSLLQQLFG